MPQQPIKDLVSVVIPTYNSGEYLAEMIQSIFKQTYNNWEIILVDDGSTDGSVKAITKYLIDKRLNLYSRPKSIPKGNQHCRNYGKTLAKGEFICFFDADDLLSVDCLEKRVETLNKSIEADFCIAPARRFTSWDKRIKIKDRVVFGLPTEDDHLAMFLSTFYPYVVWTNMYRAKAIRELYWDINVKVFQDFDFCVNGILKGLKHCYVNRSTPDYYYRLFYRRETVSSNKIGNEKLNSTIYLLSKIHMNLINKELISKYVLYIRCFSFKYLLELINGNEKSDSHIFVTSISNFLGSYECSKMQFLSEMLFRIKNNNFRKMIGLFLFHLMYGNRFLFRKALNHFNK